MPGEGVSFGFKLSLPGCGLSFGFGCGLSFGFGLSFGSGSVAG